MIRFSMRTLATLTLWGGLGLPAFAQLPALTLEKAFETRPLQAGVAIATPTPDQVARHKIDPIKNKDQTIGYVVRDAAGNAVRQFVSYDNKSFNIIAYYVNGQEAYRETKPPQQNEPIQYRWLGTNGTKWGLDKDRDGRIDEWVVISPEEVSQEVLQAVMARDPKRLEALLPTEANLKAIGLPPAEIKRIQEKSAGAVKKLMVAADSLKLTAAAKWTHLELGIPQTTPADSFSGSDDQIVHKSGRILIEDEKEANGKKEPEHKYLQIGELILVGRSWKVIEGPTAGLGDNDPNVANNGDAPLVTPEIVKIVEELDKLDPTKPDYHTKRVAILEQIVSKLKPEQQAGWAKLLIESLGGAAEATPDANPNTHLDRLKQLKDAFVAAPQNPLGPYAAFRLISAEHGILMSKAKTGQDIATAQDKNRAALETFVNAYPKSADAPEATLQLAKSFDYGKEGEAKSKQWCEHLIKNYATDPRAAKAAGIIKRLECEGKPLELAGTDMATGKPFSMQQLNGKSVVVFYWASWSTTLADDAKKLQEIAKTYGPKGVEIVCVSLEDKAADAGAWIQKVGLPGVHLHVGGGIDASPLAVNYGILVAPHVFLVGKDGKIANRNGQMFTLEDDVKKLMQ